jgi:hypothetical protein
MYLLSENVKYVDDNLTIKKESSLTASDLTAHIGKAYQNWYFVYFFRFQ